jgi:hypothetical protein
MNYVSHPNVRSEGASEATVAHAHRIKGDSQQADTSTSVAAQRTTAHHRNNRAPIKPHASTLALIEKQQTKS